MLPDNLYPFTKPVRVLDQGFVRLVRVGGGEEDIVTAARVTTGKGRSQHVWGGPEKIDGPCKVCGKWIDDTEDGIEDPCPEGDRRMLRYMMRHRHTTPLEFAEIVLHVRVPMDVWRQWIRHRTAVVNEYSTRYSEAIDAIAETPEDAWRLQATSNRQGSDGKVEAWPTRLSGIDGWMHDPEGGLLVHEEHSPVDVGYATPGSYLSARERELHQHAKAVYAERLAFGVAREQARKDLPLSNYTEAYWKINLHNLLHFLSLRLDEHAQLEIRLYAQAIAEIVKVWVPAIWEAFLDYQLRAVTLSRQEFAVVKLGLSGFLSNEPARANFIRVLESAGVSARERDTLLSKLGL